MKSRTGDRMSVDSTTAPEGPVRRRDKTSELVARAIVRRTQQQGLRPGARLPSEADMISTYRVGRGTLREALRILEVNGFITLKPGPGGGPVLEGLREESFGRMATLFFQMGGLTYRELIEARLIMEPIAARLAAQRQREVEQVDHLRSAAKVLNVTDDQDYFSHTIDFHASVIRMSGNGIVALFCQSLADVFRERVSGVLFAPDQREEIVAAHEAIARAIDSGNGTRAEKLMREHMEHYAEFVLSRYPAIMDEIVEWR